MNRFILGALVVLPVAAALTGGWLAYEEGHIDPRSARAVNGN